MLCIRLELKKLLYRKNIQKSGFFSCNNFIFWGSNRCFHYRVLGNTTSSIYMTRYYVFIAIYTHQKLKKKIENISYAYIISENINENKDMFRRILTFCTLNEHILIVKRDSDENITYGENSAMSARERHKRKKLEFQSF